MAAKKNSKNSYIEIFCRVCNETKKIYKKDDKNEFIPQAICIHAAYKGIGED